MKAVIFDMDGVLVHNDRYHVQAWKQFCREYGKKKTDNEIKSWFGSTNKTILETIFQKEIPDEEAERMGKKKEEIYRNIYRDDIKPLPGLKDFLEQLKSAKVKTALATSAPEENVDFVLERTGLFEFFEVRTNASEIKSGKPDPEIFLKTSAKLKIEPENCIVFEDSFQGIRAARNAGMKVIGVATSHKRSELKGLDSVIDDFTRIQISDLIKLWSKS